ncbi:hypothetical protein D3C78_1756820 [compost metagenome]
MQLADLAVGIELGLTEGGEQLTQRLLCLRVAQFGGIPLCERLQPVLLLPRQGALAQAVAEKDQQGKAEQCGRHHQPLGG